MVLAAPCSDKPRRGVFLPRRKCRIITKLGAVWRLRTRHHARALRHTGATTRTAARTLHFKERNMSTVAIGKPVPDFELPATGNQTIRLSNLKGHNVVLYFSPKDDTPGCPLEGQNFRDMHADFKRAKTVILGISRDGLASHEGFKAKLAFPFELLADEEERVCKLFDVIKPKNMYGREVIGVERSTFLIDADGVLRREWRKVKEDGHADEVLEAVKAL